MSEQAKKTLRQLVIDAMDEAENNPVELEILKGKVYPLNVSLPYDGTIQVNDLTWGNIGENDLPEALADLVRQFAVAAGEAFVNLKLKDFKDAVKSFRIIDNKQEWIRPAVSASVKFEPSKSGQAAWKIDLATVLSVLDNLEFIGDVVKIESKAEPIF